MRSKPLFGVERSRIMLEGGPYMDRYIAYIGGLTLRLHKFFRGDDNRAPHDHPWWFITFPFKSYTEKYWEHYRMKRYRGHSVEDLHDDPYGPWEDVWTAHTREVKSWRFHFRPANFRHIVIGRADGKTTPFWTFVISGKLRKRWGFYPTPTTFIHWKEWK